MKIVHRYPTVHKFHTSLDIDQDLPDLIQAYSSHGVVSDVLRQQHGFKDSKQIKSAAREIVPLVRQGLRFLDQARSGPRLVSYLPYYYAFLQFAKAVIVARRGAAVVSSALKHGVSYRPTAKNSHSIDSEMIHIHSEGVFPLYYETLTGQAVPDLRRKKGSKTLISVQMRNVYPFIMDAGFEYMNAVNATKLTTATVLLLRDTSGGKATYVLKVYSDPKPKRTESALLNRFGTDEQGRRLSTDREALAYLLYQPMLLTEQHHVDPPLNYLTPLWNGRLQYPEEIPLFLTFFHLGSVVRYKPRFLERVIDSPFYPFLLAAERHCTTKLLLLCLNAMAQTTYLPYVGY